MLNSDVKPLRSWCEIAEEIVEGRDPNRTLQLAKELIRALERETGKSTEEMKAKENVEARHSMRLPEDSDSHYR